MHTGRTIEELIKLVQHIHTERGTYPGTATKRADSASAKSSSAAVSSLEPVEPAWLAVFQ